MSAPPSAAALDGQVQGIEALLRRHADPRRADGGRRYLKSDLEFIGCPVPLVRSVTHEWAKGSPLASHDALVALVEALWRREVHELRVVALALLQRHAALLTSADLPLIETLIRRSGTWAYVDVLAIDLAGSLVERDAGLNAALDRWAIDSDFWVRRSALLALLRPIRAGRGDFERFARYAEGMLDEREFFIRKAIGWVLREASKRRPELVADWIAPRVTRVSGVTVREAVKYLDPAVREVILTEYSAARRGHRTR